MDDFLEDMFDAGWRDYVRSIRQENAKSNRRLYKLLVQIKGKSFVDSIKRLATQNGSLPQIRISRQPVGIKMKDNRWSAILEIWIDQKQTEQGVTGFVYVQVKKDRFLKIHY